MKLNDKTIVANIYPSLNFSKIRDYITLTKPRLLSSVLLSTVLGYFLPVNSSAEVLSLLNLLLGTAMIGSGAHTLNQWQEQIPDSKMRRTKNRPLPTGKLSGNEALAFGIIISVAGFTTLWLSLNILTAALGLLTLFSYILIYTPLKQKSVSNTWFGGITGGLPPVMGWTAARGSWTGKYCQFLPCFIFGSFHIFLQLPGCIVMTTAEAGSKCFHLRIQQVKKPVFKCCSTAVCFLFLALLFLLSAS